MWIFYFGVCVCFEFGSGLVAFFVFLGVLFIAETMGLGFCMCLLVVLMFCCGLLFGFFDFLVCWLFVCGVGLVLLLGLFVLFASICWVCLFLLVLLWCY